jgi:stage II sporulation SpoAA-like protein
MEKIAGLPAGVIGLRASGELTREEYRDTLEPVLHDAVEGGDVRLLLMLEEDFLDQGLDGGRDGGGPRVGRQLNRTMAQ